MNSRRFAFAERAYAIGGDVPHRWSCDAGQTPVGTDREYLLPVADALAMRVLQFNRFASVGPVLHSLDVRQIQAVSTAAFGIF
jgi:hypothetical protein